MKKIFKILQRSNKYYYHLYIVKCPLVGGPCTGHKSLCQHVAGLQARLQVVSVGQLLSDSLSDGNLDTHDVSSKMADGELVSDVRKLFESFENLKLQP